MFTLAGFTKRTMTMTHLCLETTTLHIKRRVQGEFMTGCTEEEGGMSGSL